MPEIRGATDGRRAISAASEIELELRDLRARAYGPDADIHDDPVALARLAELEAGRHGGESTVEPEGPVLTTGVSTIGHSGGSAAIEDRPQVGSPEPSVAASVVRKTKARPLLAFGAGVGVAGLAVATVMAMSASQPPDSALMPTHVEPDGQLIALLESEGDEHEMDRASLRGASEMEIDLSTLRAFGTYRDFEIWAAMNVFRSNCLIAVHRATADIVARECVPVGAELFLDTVLHGLGPGERLRFVMRDDVVDVRLLTPERAGDG